MDRHKARAILLAVLETCGYILLLVTCLLVLMLLLAWGLQGLGDGLDKDFFRFVRDLGDAWRGE